MPNVNKYRIIVAALVVVVIGLAAILLSQQNNAGPSLGQSVQNLVTSTANLASGTSPGSPAGQTPSGGTNAPVAPKPALTGFTIHLRTPIAGETWTIGHQNTISWDRAAGVSGQIELLDAATKALVGVIISQTGPNQTSYAWNTRDVFLSRTNPLKKTVTPGAYMVRLLFDGNNISSVTSGVFTIAQ